MWSDTLLAAERSHLIRIALWAAASATVGMTLVGVIALRRLTAPIVMWFAIQTLAWGSMELVVTTARWHALGMRDVSAATHLDRLTWLAAGLDVGLIGVGAAIAAMAWSANRRLGAFGAGLGVIVQGLALLVLDLTFASNLARLV
jgi:hypothetical protein